MTSPSCLTTSSRRQRSASISRTSSCSVDSALALRMAGRASSSVAPSRRAMHTRASRRNSSGLRGCVARSSCSRAWARRQSPCSTSNSARVMPTASASLPSAACAALARSRSASRAAMSPTYCAARAACSQLINGASPPAAPASNSLRALAASPPSSARSPAFVVRRARASCRCFVNPCTKRRGLRSIRANQNTARSTK